MQFQLRDRAKADLADIWLSTAARWGVDQAEDYTRMIGERMAKICDYPLSHPQHEGRLKGFRKMACGQHLVFYRIEGEMIDIVRVLHNAMDTDDNLS